MELHAADGLLVVRGIGERGYYQPGTSVNYPGLEVPYTRSTEYKHYPEQPPSNHTVVVRETSTSAACGLSCAGATAVMS